jgi:hypothetical protein
VAPPEADTFQWSLPKPQVGFLIADQDLGPQDTTSAVRGFCAEFGNACILTSDTLRFYNLPTVLYAAPTCDVLPTQTSRQFTGGTVKIKVAVKGSGRKLGKATTTVVWGDPSFAGVTLYAFGQDGIGVDTVQGFIDTQFNAIPGPPPPNGPVVGYEFEWLSDSETADTCPSQPADACVTLSDENSAGNSLATVRARLEDGSALCDNLTVHVGTCPRKAQLQIIRVPSKKTYTNDDAVSLRVRFANLSRNDPGCGLQLSGANVFQCEATFKLGQTEETKTEVWDLQHCSETTAQPCTTDADCICPGCQPNEVCLTESHCSETFTVPCDGDSDCEEPACATCNDNETCIRVLAVPELVVAPGQAVDLVDEVVILKNQIGDPVAVAETWTANAIPGTTAQAGIKYKIKGSK